MESIAILIDGGFYQRKAMYCWGEKSPQERAKELYEYCMYHVADKQRSDKKTVLPRSANRLYRIFYYDCPPSEKKVFHPLLGKTIDLGKSDQFKWYTAFLEEMRHLRKVALRLGKLSDSELRYELTYDTTKKLFAGSISIAEIKQDDFELNIEQKGVDMRIGLDISSMAYKKQVSRIILVSGDSDFVPAAKHARREGIDFILDPMWNHITPELMEHIDGLKTYAPNPGKRNKCTKLPPSIVLASSLDASVCPAVSTSQARSRHQHDN